MALILLKKIHPAGRIRGTAEGRVATVSALY
jgi:hypothetical protein